MEVEKKLKKNDLNARINRLRSDLLDGGALLKQLDNYQELFSDSVNYLNNKSHRVAFIGNVGTGKTTAICGLLGLTNKNKPALSIGSGRTTLCEVEISKGSTTKILVEPYSKDEIMSYISDFSLSYSTNSLQEDGEVFKLSAEIDRALRNILGLAKNKKIDKESGKRTVYDPVPDLRLKYELDSEFIKELENRFNFDSRTETVFYNTDSTPEPEWLSDIFKSINHGTNDSVSLSKKISIELKNAEWNQEGFDLTFVDTKGVDQTVNRNDLDVCLTDDRTVSILCSRFNDAPDKTVVGVYKQAKEAGLINRISDESLILVLDRENEPEQVIDIDEPIDDKDEGREIRKSQIELDLKSKLSIMAHVSYYNSVNDNKEGILSEIVNKVKGLRDFHRTRLHEIETAIDDLEKEAVSLSQKEAKDKIANTIEPWLIKAKKVNLHTNEYFLPLVQSISDKGTYAASVRASVNRNGEWQNLDYYQILASGARQRVVEIIGTLNRELFVLLENMLEQPELKPAYALIRQLRDTANKRIIDLTQQAYAKGRAVYESDLRNDNSFWNALYSEWGQGAGYKQRVASTTHQWFNLKDYAIYEKKVRISALEQWVNLINEISGLSGL